MALLAVALFVAGFGTMAFLRTTLMNSEDEQLRQLSSSDYALNIFERSYSENGTVHFTPDDSASNTGYFVAIYGPPDGSLQAFADGTGGGHVPPIPETFTLEETYLRGTGAFSITDPETGEHYHASADVFEVPGMAAYYTQLIVAPLATTERVVAAYIGIYGILALLIVISGALLTRWLVTLTFRGLGQVEATAMSIAAGDFGQRLPDVVPGTEVGRLKAAINTMLGRVDAAIRQREATVRQMRRFIGDASHELRTPLVTVRGYAELYRMGALRTDEDIAQAMERIEKEAKRMGVLVEDLLALARLDEKRDVVIAPVDLRPIARDAAMDLRAASPQREITVEDTTLTDPISISITVDPEPEDQPPDAGRRRATPATSAIALAGATLSRLRRRSRAVDADGHALAEQQDAEATTTTTGAVGMRIPPIVMGDENRIRQVVANLLGNARRFTASDSPIGLRVGVDAKAAAGWIEVIDHGEGIPEQIREQIFQRFWRADNSRTRETGGSGLGLSIVASIVEALHGAVSVTETPGGGATFRVSFPLAPQDRGRQASDRETSAD